MIVDIKKLGNLQEDKPHESQAVYSENGASQTITAGTHGYGMGYILDQKIVAMRGRDPLNPSDRSIGNPNLEQTLEINSQNVANTLTTVQKDNMVLEVKQATKDGYIKCEIGGGGRSELSQQYNTQRKSPRERTDKPNSDNGEYP